MKKNIQLLLVLSLKIDLKISHRRMLWIFKFFLFLKTQNFKNASFIYVLVQICQERSMERVGSVLNHWEERSVSRKFTEFVRLFVFLMVVIKETENPLERQVFIMSRSKSCMRWYPEFL